MKKRIIFYLLFFLALFVFAEIIARAYYYRRPAQSRLATHQLFNDVKRLLFPQRRRWDRRSEYFFRTTVSRAVNDSIVMEADAANKLIYQPWIAFSCANSKGKYVNPYDRIRNTTPSTCAGTGDTV